MLYDPKWNPFTLESLIAWLETKDPQEKFEFGLPENCLAAQYFTAMNEWDRYWKAERSRSEFRLDQLIPGLHEIAIRNHTFGEALAMARQFSART